MASITPPSQRAQGSLTTITEILLYPHLQDCPSFTADCSCFIIVLINCIKQAVKGGYYRHKFGCKLSLKCFCIAVCQHFSISVVRNSVMNTGPFCAILAVILKCNFKSYDISSNFPVISLQLSRDSIMPA